MTRTGLLMILLVAFAPQDAPKPYRLPSTDLKQQVIWGSTCEVPGGPALAFGGEDQEADDGRPHTQIKIDGRWTSIGEELRKANPFRKVHETLRALAAEAKDAKARSLGAWLDGASIDAGVKALKSLQFPDDIGEVRDPEGRSTSARAGLRMEQAKMLIRSLEATDGPVAIRRMEAAQILLEWAAETIGPEPPARALSPLAYDARSGLFVLFGGDHLDYLTNDLWFFDPVKRRWFGHHPEEAPPPRANHSIRVNDGTIVISGGYTYTSSTDYCGGQYRDHGDGDWSYTYGSGEWKGTGTKAPTGIRTYRRGRLHPDHYLDGPAPDPGAVQERLASIPTNTWTSMKPPQLPALNRDWGTAVYDPDRELILRWSGGHSAHGGTDVLKYHTRTNRWELTHPVEFPLGQLYANTDYPEGLNFNRRPWITGHTYQSYGYDPNLKKMLFTGRRDYYHVYDPEVGDWTDRYAKPLGMDYGSSFYTLTITSTPEGLVCWTHDGKLFRYSERHWRELPLRGSKLPGSVVDNSTLVHDSKRNRLLFARKPYGDKAVYDGILSAVDLKSGEVSSLAPAGKEKAGAIPYLCQLRYDPTNDLVLGGCTLPPDEDGFRRTPAYDCAGDRWVSLRIGGDDPSGKKGRNVSLGMMYDAKRKLFWAVDTNSNVFVLRLDVATADLKPL